MRFLVYMQFNYKSLVIKGQNQMNYKRRITIFLFFGVFLNAVNCQISFDDGYYIDDSGNRVNCRIKNDDPHSNPTMLYYKLEAGNKILVRGVENTREFGVLNEFKYIKSKVSIDKSKSDLSKLDYKMNMNYEEEILFLKVLLEGECSLYQYKESKLERYFYKAKEGPIKQLDYKSYKVSTNRIRENNRFRQQLKIEMNCESSDDLIKSLQYKKKSLIGFFKQYNSCKGSKFKIYKKSKNGKKITIGVRYDGMFAKSTLNIKDDDLLDYDVKLVNQFGLSFEYIMPVKKNKWRVFIEPTYYQYKSEKKSISYIDAFNIENVETFELVNQAVEISMGIRHYIYVTNKTQMFFNGGYYIDVYSRSKLNFNRTTPDFSSDIVFSGDQSIGNILIGLGIQFDRFSLGYRYKRGKNFTVGTGWTTRYRGSSISLRLNVL